MKDFILNLLDQYAIQFGVDPQLAKNVALHESGFNPNARSPKGAMGVMQLMPATATQLGVKNPFDPEENIRGGVKHLSYLLGKYGGRTDLALAAYNAGEGNVAKYNGIPPFPETAKYVQNVMGDNPPQHPKMEKLMPTNDVLPNLQNLPQVMGGGGAFDLSTLLQAARGLVPQPFGAPMPDAAAGTYKPLAPLPDQSGLKLAQVLGHLAGIAGPQFGKVGSTIAGLAAEDLKTAKADEAARSLGFGSNAQLEAALKSTHARATSQYGAAQQAKALQDTVAGMKGIAGLPQEMTAPTQIYPGGPVVPLTGKEIAGYAYAAKRLNLDTAKLTQYDLPHLEVMRQNADVNAALHAKNVPIEIVNPATGKKEVREGTMQEYIANASKLDPVKAAKLSSGYDLLTKMITAFDARYAEALKRNQAIGGVQKPISPLSLFGTNEIAAFDAVLPTMLDDPHLADKALYVQKLLGLVRKRKDVTYPDLRGKSILPPPVSPRQGMTPEESTFLLGQ